MSSFFTIRLEAVAIRLEAIASRLEVIASRLEAIVKAMRCGCWVTHYPLKACGGTCEQRAFCGTTSIQL